MSDQDLRPIVNGLIAKTAGIPLESLKDPQRRLADLGMDSLAVVELLFEIEDKYGVHIDDPLQLKDLDLSQLYLMIGDLIQNKELTASSRGVPAGIAAAVQTHEA